MTFLASRRLPTPDWIDNHHQQQQCRKNRKFVAGEHDHRSQTTCAVFFWVDFLQIISKSNRKWSKENIWLTVVQYQPLSTLYLLSWFWYHFRIIAHHAKKRIILLWHIIYLPITINNHLRKWQRTGQTGKRYRKYW